MKKPITCCVCGREIAPEQRYEKVKSRSGGQLYVHTDCHKKKRSDDE